MLAENKNTNFDKLPCTTVLYRALLKKSWINPDTNEIISAAYIPRPTQDNEGLSVGISKTNPEDRLPEAQVFSLKFTKCFGVGSLLCGRIREITCEKCGSNKLDVIQDAPDHALIVGIQDIDDQAEKEHTAGQLAKITRLLLDCRTQ